MQPGPRAVQPQPEPEPEPELRQHPWEQPHWGSESRFALRDRAPPAPWARDGVAAVPSLQSLCLVWLAGRLDDVESLEGLPPAFTELACFAASRRAPWKDDPRSLWTDALLPNLAGDGVTTLDLSGSPCVTDASMRYLAEHPGMRESLKHISVVSTAVTLQGIGALIRGCAKRLEYIDMSRCAGVDPNRIASVLPVRTPPDGWEDEADERWRESYPTLSTIVYRDAPGPVIALLKERVPWIRVNPPDWETTPLEACGLGVELLCPACLWVRPQPSEVAARLAAERAAALSEEERARGKWGPGDRSPAQRMMDAIDHAEAVGGDSRRGGKHSEVEREGAVYLRRHDAGQPGLTRQINRLNERRRILG